MEMAKLGTSIFFLIVFTMQVITPVFPYLEYACNKANIAKDLCIKQDEPNNTCQGKCYLKKQLKKSNPVQKGKSPNRVETKEWILSLTPTSGQQIWLLFRVYSANFYHGNKKISNPELEPPTLPPQQLLA